MFGRVLGLGRALDGKISQRYFEISGYYKKLMVNQLKDMKLYRNPSPLGAKGPWAQGPNRSISLWGQGWMVRRLVGRMASRTNRRSDARTDGRSHRWSVGPTVGRTDTSRSVEQSDKREFLENKKSDKKTHLQN